MPAILLLPLRKAALALSASAALGLSGCMGGDDDDGGLVDTYAPTYLEAKGTVHAGDWYPLRAGEAVNARGTMTGASKMSMRGTVQGRAISEDQNEPISEVMTLSSVTLAAVSRAFVQGDFTVFPQVTTTTTASTDENGMPLAEVEANTSYYQQTAEAIYLRGTQSGDQPLVEPAKPLFLKLPLKVGDSWDSESAEVPTATDGGTVSVTSRARTYVVGLESVTIGGKPVSALRLDQVSEVTGTMTDPEGMAMNITGEFTNVIHLVEGQGQVRQSLKAKMSMKGSATQGGDRINITMSMDMQGVIEKAEGLAKSSLPRVTALPSAPVRGHSGGTLSAARSFSASAASSRAATLTALRRLAFRAP